MHPQLSVPRIPARSSLLFGVTFMLTFVVEKVQNKKVKNAKNVTKEPAKMFSIWELYS